MKTTRCIMPRRYRANLGGHAPGHLRDALCQALERAEGGIVAHWSEALADEEVLSHIDQDFQRSWERWPVKRRARWLLEQLHNCTDIMGRTMCSCLDLPPGATFARAARKLREELELEVSARK
jgi:hypothetical protein